MGKFSDQVKGFGRKYESNVRAVMRTAVQETVAKAQNPRGAGGRMPIVTGFLHASIQAGLHTMPKGPTTNEGNKNYKLGTQVAGEPVAVTLLRWDPNTRTPLLVGWTAVYARHMEAKYGFLRGALEVWDQTVAEAARRVR